MANMYLHLAREDGKNELSISQAAAAARIYQALSSKLYGLDLGVKLSVWFKEREGKDKKHGLSVSLDYSPMGRALWDHHFSPKAEFWVQSYHDWDRDVITTQILEELLEELKSNRTGGCDLYPAKDVMYEFLSPKAFAAPSQYF